MVVRMVKDRVWRSWICMHAVWDGYDTRYRAANLEELYKLVVNPWQGLGGANNKARHLGSIHRDLLFIFGATTCQIKSKCTD